MIHQQSPVPLYRQLSGIIEEKINTGEYPPHTKIPSEHELAKQYSLGRPTVRQALDFLVRQGLLEKQKGRGTFVQDKSEAIDLFSLAGTSTAFYEKGISVKKNLLSPVKKIRLPETPKHPLSGREVLYFQRLFSVDNKPVLIDELWIDHLVFPGIEDIDFSVNSVSEVIKQRYYLSPDSCIQSFTIESPPPLFQNNLALRKQQQVLLVKRTLGFGQYSDAVYSHLWCRTDTYQFSQKIKER